MWKLNRLGRSISHPIANSRLICLRSGRNGSLSSDRRTIWRLADWGCVNVPTADRLPFLLGRSHADGDPIVYLDDAGR